MSANNINTPGVWLTIGLVGALAWIAIAMEPGRLWAYGIAMGLLPISVVGLSILGRVTSWGKKSETAYRLLRVSLIGAGAVLAGSLGFTILQSAGYVSEGTNGDAVAWVTIAIWWVALSVILARSKSKSGCAE